MIENGKLVSKRELVQKGPGYNPNRRSDGAFASSPGGAKGPGSGSASMPKPQHMPNGNVISAERSKLLNEYSKTSGVAYEASRRAGDFHKTRAEASAAHEKAGKLHRDAAEAAKLSGSEVDQHLSLASNHEGRANSYKIPKPSKGV